MFLAMCICMPLIVLLCSLAPSEPLTTPQTLVNSLVSRDIDPSIPTMRSLMRHKRICLLIITLSWVIAQPHFLKDQNGNHPQIPISNGLGLWTVVLLLQMDKVLTPSL